MKHEIIIYEDARGRAPLREYLKKLKSQKTPDAELRRAEREYKDWIERNGEI